MKLGSTLILRAATLFAGAIVLAFCVVCIWLAATDRDPNSIYAPLYYILIFGTFASAIPFFIALYQALKLLGYIDANCAFSIMAVNSLQIIMRCAIAIFVICTVGGLPFFYCVAQLEDAPGLMLIGFVISGSAFIIAVFSSILKRLLQDAINIKADNDMII